MHAVIGAVVVVDSCDDNVFFYDYEPRFLIKPEDAEYYGFDNNVDVDEYIDCTSS